MKKLPVDFEQTIGFWLDYSNSTFNLGTIFKKIQFNSTKYEINWVLCFVTDSSFLDFTSIENGYKTIVLIKLDKSLTILDNIPIIQNWYSDNKVNEEVFLFVNKVLLEISYLVY
ncbi:hypothetical protein H9X57_18260 [Flavobacterium piscinae]|uniref:hypothetical protein n=1 Tax=Flavobacterium piscinae TaxID=2506424 RepID=UPI00199FE5C6|nr:hypothetical protein [Flavobacterium piscinae]MBC8884619.1 hypothetical protein [Flavobacterium piscinae]